MLLPTFVPDAASIDCYTPRVLEMMPRSVSSLRNRWNAIARRKRLLSA